MAPHLAPAVLAGGYGYGLAAMSDAELGITINHGGGYPGFGSYMAWHPASGIGIVGLANLRYASPRDLADRQLAALVAADGVVRRRVRPVPRDRGVPAGRDGAPRAAGTTPSRTARSR